MITILIVIGGAVGLLALALFVAGACRIAREADEQADRLWREMGERRGR